MTIKDICIKYNLKQTELADRFGIPLRTVQDWHGERRTPPEYVVRMMVEILELTRVVRQVPNGTTVPVRYIAPKKGEESATEKYVRETIERWHTEKNNQP